MFLCVTAIIQGQGYIGFEHAGTRNFYTTVIEDSTYDNVQDYGAVGDGVANDFSAFQNAITTSIANKKKVYIPAGTYNIDDYLNFAVADSGKVEIVGIGGPVLDFSSLDPVSSQFCLSFVASQGTSSPTIDADIAKGDTIIHSDSITVSQNDRFKIWSDAPWGMLSESGDTTQYKGQILTVQSVSNDTIYVDEYITTSFDSTNTYIRRLPQIEVHIEGVTIIGNPDNLYMKGVYVTCGRNVSIRNITVKDCRYAGIQLNECYGALVENNTVMRVNRGGTGYGIIALSSENVMVRRNILIDCRHGVDFSGGYPTRHSWIEANYITVRDPHFYGVSTHDASEDIIIRDNFIDGGGIHVRGINTKILDNRLYAKFPTQSYGIRIGNRVLAERSRFFEVSGNEVIQHDTSNVNGNGIYYFDRANKGCERVVIRNNKVLVNDAALDVRADSAHTINNFIIQSNDFTAANSSEGSGIYMSDLPHVENMLILNNIIRSEEVGIYYGSPDTIEVLRIEGNDIYGEKYSIYPLSRVRDLHVLNNRLAVDSGNAVREEPYLHGWNLVNVANNRIEHPRNLRYTIGLPAESPDDSTAILYDYDNIYVNASTSYARTKAKNIDLGWTDDKENYYTKTNLQTSGGAEIHSKNLTDFDIFTTTSDSIVIDKTINAYHIYSGTVDANGGSDDTLVVTIHFTNSLSTTQNAYGEFLLTLNREGVTQQFALGRVSFYAGGNGTTLKDEAVNYESLANVTVNHPTAAKEADADMDKLVLYFLNNYASNPAKATVNTTSLYNIQSIVFSVK